MNVDTVQIYIFNRIGDLYTWRLLVFPQSKQKPGDVSSLGTRKHMKKRILQGWHEGIFVGPLHKIAMT
jgi:hypothetical protein